MRAPLALLRGADISKISKDRKLSIPHSASREAFCGDGNVSRSNGVPASHGIPQVAIHSQVASPGTGVVNVLDAGRAMQ
jgi:hypothetical protein